MTVERRRSLDVALTVPSNQPLPIKTAGTLQQIGASGGENTPLASGASYTSSLIDCSEFATIRGSVLTDQNGVVYVEYSWDNGTTYIGESNRQDVDASTPTGFISYVVAPSCRIVFLNNSGSPQTIFSIGFGGMLV
jgi:hypothetical protein